MNSADQERFNRIRRETGNGYGITLKDLAWLVRLVEKLEKPVAGSQPPVASVPNKSGPDRLPKTRRPKTMRRSA